MTLDSKITNDSKFDVLSPLIVQEINVEVRYGFVNVVYSHDFKLSRQNSPIDFIPEFLKQKGYEILKDETGNEFYSDENCSILSSMLGDDLKKPSIEVILDMDGMSTLSYLGRDISQLPVANELMLKMIDVYKK